MQLEKELAREIGEIIKEHTKAELRREYAAFRAEMDAFTKQLAEIVELAARKPEKGADGKDGRDGSSITAGEGPPLRPMPVGTLYVDVKTGDLYEFRS